MPSSNYWKSISRHPPALFVCALLISGCASPASEGPAAGQNGGSPSSSASPSPSPSASPSSSASGDKRRRVEGSGPQYASLEEALGSTPNIGGVRGEVVREITTTNTLDEPAGGPALRYQLLEFSVASAPGVRHAPDSIVLAQVANDDVQQAEGFGPELAVGDTGVVVLGTAMSQGAVHPEYGWVYYAAAAYSEADGARLTDRVTGEAAAPSTADHSTDELLREANQGLTLHPSALTS